ncbi:hypothetical protein SKAU_G00089990 [Synaphobranchus kaupii]|uniref:C-type lectin domain-containing protein n=1 Tax=Synaphobranchus kaupii TaxID=118154 RepID=A0A9Q1J6C6_SYNKA|nr:hypothetical protein SKAU_G00089990 [Synaphobranchus kaupii]
MSASISNPACATPEQCIYSTVSHISGNSEAPRSEKSGQSSHPYRLAAVCLGLLCALLLAATLVLGVLYLRGPKYVSQECSEMDRELEELRANYSRSIEVERQKNNMAFIAMLEERYSYLDQYCPLISKKRACKPCPQGWEQFCSKCYYFSTERKSWIDSHSDCLKRGADLVIIESEEEQVFISNHTRDYNWIGLSDMETEGTWLWVDNTLLHKGFWGSREPDNHNVTENKTHDKGEDADCVVMVPDENRWNDARCFSKCKFVCETDALVLNNLS